jgi:hypothetical protein
LALTRAINLRKAAVGDPVAARVARDVKKNGEVIIPKGATAAGRITRIERYERYSIVGVEFPEIEAPGMLARMKGSLEHTVGVLPVTHPYSMRGRSPLVPGEGVFPVNDNQFALPKGCIMFWRT